MLSLEQLLPLDDDDDELPEPLSSLQPETKSALMATVTMAVNTVARTNMRISSRRAGRFGPPRQGDAVQEDV